MAPATDGPIPVVSGSCDSSENHGGARCENDRSATCAATNGSSLRSQWPIIFGALTLRGSVGIGRLWGPNSANKTGC
jgi:hypothetical protein